MADFDLDAFLAGMERDKSKVADPSSKLNKVLMNTQDNQGIVTFIPFLSSSFNNFYLKIPRVYEFFGNTSLLNSGEGWMKLLPIDFYGELNSDEMQLYQQVKSLLNELDNYEIGYDEYRVRTYSLFTGIQVSHKSNKNGQLNDLNDCACVYVFPSNSPIDAMNTAINGKIDAMKGNRNWLSAIFSPATVGRKGVIQISFSKSTGAGYDSNVSFELNSDFNIIVDPEKQFSDDQVKLFTEALSVFMGWNYDRDNSRMFNTTFMKEFKFALESRIKQLSEENEPLPEPKDPSVEQAEVPDPAQTEESPAPKKKVPF